MPSEPEPRCAIVVLDDGRTEVVLKFGERVVSWATIIPMTMRYGVATLRMDGIGGVGTEEEYRHRGYSRRVMEAAVARMRTGPAVLTTLYGIQGFYPKYGYATLGPESIILFRDLREGGELPSGWEVRRARVGDLPAIQAIYDGCTAEATGALVREPDGVAWARLRQSLERDDGECRVVLDPAGAVAGYGWRATGCWWMASWEDHRPGGLKLAEAFATSPLAAAALLAGGAAWAAELRQDSFALGVPAEGHVGMAAMLRSCEVTQGYTRAGEFMGRVVGAESLLRAIAPELTRVWAASGSRFRGELALDTGEESTRLALGDAGVAVVESSATPGARLAAALAPGELARLVCGGMLPAEQLATLPGVGPEAAEVLTALFPCRFPYIYPADRF